MAAFSRMQTPALSRVHSHSGSISSIPHSIDSTIQSRPSLYSFPSTGQSISLGGSRPGKPHRKRKKRVVNLRKQSEIAENAETEFNFEDGSTVTDSTSVTGDTSEAPSIFSDPPPTSSSSLGKERESMSPMTSPRLPRKTGSLGDAHESARPRLTSSSSHSMNRVASRSFGDDPFTDKTMPDSDHNATLRAKRRTHDMRIDIDATPRASMYLGQAKSAYPQEESSIAPILRRSVTSDEKAFGAPSPTPLPNFVQFLNDSASSRSIAERAWMMKMASEMSRKYDEERAKGSFDPYQPPKDDISPPPAYAR